MSSNSMTLKQWALLSLIAIVWGTSFFLIEIILREMGPFTLVFYRVFFAALLVNLVLLLRGERIPLDGASLRRFLVLGAFNNFIPFSLISSGQVFIDGSLASILNATTPVFGVLMAHYLTEDEKLTRARLLGATMALIGVIILLGPGVLGGLTTNLFGKVAVLGAAMSYAYASIYAKRFGDMPILQAISGTLVAATLLAAIPAFLLETPRLSGIATVTWASVFFIAFAATAFTYLLYFYIIRAAGATNTLLVVFLVPVTAIFLGVVFLDEVVTLQMLAGMLVIFSGLGLVDGRILHRFAKSRRKARPGNGQ